VGGTVVAYNCAAAFEVEVGRSDGTPGQAFALPHAPILERRRGEVLLVGERGAPLEEFATWTEVADFSCSQAEDRHFLLDSASGQILFGPNITEPDGNARSYGAVPPRGHILVFKAYRFGGGVAGNVRDNSVRVLKSSIPYIATVTNPRRAIGGRDGESLQRAILRGQGVLKQRERAVTGEDYEHLARRASPGVGRAHCVQPRAARANRNEGEVPPGVVRLLIVPALGEQVLVPRPEDLQVSERTLDEVREFLDGRRLLTTVMEVGEPQYLWVSTDITLVADPNADAEAVARRVQEKLAAFVHPLTGGPNGQGWPFRRTLTLADVYAQVQAAQGVAFLLGAEMSVARLLNAEEGLLGPETPVPNAEGVRCAEGELLVTNEHRVSVRPMWSVGMEED
jgi:predicted phage baseplate assembly protein